MRYVFIVCVFLCFVNALNINYSIESQGQENSISVQKTQRVLSVCSNQSSPALFFVSRKGDNTFPTLEFFSKYGYFASLCLNETQVCQQVTSGVSSGDWDDFFLVSLSTTTPTPFHISTDFRVSDVTWCSF